VSTTDGPCGGRVSAWQAVKKARTEPLMAGPIRAVLTVAKSGIGVLLKSSQVVERLSSSGRIRQQETKF
jgi:hypothetical protein